MIMGSNIEFLRFIDVSGVNCSVFTTTSESYNITDNYDIDKSIFKQRMILDISKPNATVVWGDDIHQYFKPQYEKLEKEMDEISREYDRKYQELIRKIPKNHSYSGLSTPIEFLVYHSVRRLSDDELIKRVKQNQWISDRDRQRVNDDELIPGLYLTIY